MELNMAYVVSERPAVGRSGPMVDPEGLSRCPSLIPDWPCICKRHKYPYPRRQSGTVGRVVPNENQSSLKPMAAQLLLTAW